MIDGKELQPSTAHFRCSSTAGDMALGCIVQESGCLRFGQAQQFDDQMKSWTPRAAACTKHAALQCPSLHVVNCSAHYCLWGPAYRQENERNASGRREHRVCVGSCQAITHEGLRSRWCDTVAVCLTLAPDWFRTRRAARAME